jgi:hypothetical protein
MPPYLLRPRHRLFEEYDQRLRQAPDPAAAQISFERRLRDMRRGYRIRGIAFGGLYFSAATTAVGVALRNVAAYQDLRGILDAIAGLTSSLTVIFLALIFLTGRYIAHLEVELLYYSMEARLEPSRV